ncbi:DUF3800 domain-containing protein [Maridesulfovibrio sp.]|uniref:DUF3800 domain-containing protein n=1 Tax=Maridesulfovibrio sp. TaxID=2795000 RepID=UPI0029CA8075|nr:DUF3800 domain-containing protein [Maridesulfovibrio sp.]
MDFEVYCDENFPDLFTSTSPKARYMMIGGLWIPSGLRSHVKESVSNLRERHQAWGEIKWTKVSPSKIDFYLDLIDLFFSYQESMRFRCIAIDREVYDGAINNGDNELGFYKFYYQLIHHWVADHNTYKIFCDTKTSRDKTRLSVLHRCLCNSNHLSQIQSIQALPSKQVVLIQLCDLLLGAASSRINETLTEGSAKSMLVQRIENRLGIYKLAPTYRDAIKFNIFKINLQGGW